MRDLFCIRLSMFHFLKNVSLALSVTEARVTSSRYKRTIVQYAYKLQATTGKDSFCAKTTYVEDRSSSKVPPLRSDRLIALTHKVT